jgi:hypothetical protein
LGWVVATPEALCEAMSRPTMRSVPVKTAEQQAALMLVGMDARSMRASFSIALPLMAVSRVWGPDGRVSSSATRALSLSNFSRSSPVIMYLIAKHVLITCERQCCGTLHCDDSHRFSPKYNPVCNASEQRRHGKRGNASLMIYRIASSFCGMKLIEIVL